MRPINTLCLGVNMHYLYLLRQPPYQSSLAREALDMVLATAAFDQQVSLLFINDGVFQLQNTQQAERLEQKNISKTLQALALYEVESVYYCQASVAQRGLDITALYSAAKALKLEACQALMSKADKVISL